MDYIYGELNKKVLPICPNIPLQEVDYIYGQLNQYLENQEDGKNNEG